MVAGGRKGFVLPQLACLCGTHPASTSRERARFYFLSSEEKELGILEKEASFAFENRE